MMTVKSAAPLSAMDLGVVALQGFQFVSSSSSVIPMTPFMGVRNLVAHIGENSLLARFRARRTAAILVLSSTRFSSSSCERRSCPSRSSICSSMSLKAPMRRPISSCRAPARAAHSPSPCSPARLHGSRPESDRKCSVAGALRLRAQRERAQNDRPKIRTVLEQRPPVVRRGRQQI